MLVSWKSAKSGAWEDSDKWSGGVVPTVSDDVQFAAAGKYFVTIASTIGFNSLDLGGKVTLFEYSTGSIIHASVGGITLHDGATMQLNAVNANLAGYISVSKGTLIVGQTGALGSASIDLFGGATFLSAVDFTFTNSLNTGLLPGGKHGVVTLAAADAATLTLATKMEVGADVVFGSATEDGTVVLASGPGKIAKSHSFEVAGGTLALGSDKAALYFDHNGKAGVALKIDAGGTFDLAGHSTTLDSLGAAVGSHIVGSGKATTLALRGANDAIGADISGQVQLDLGDTLNDQIVTGAVSLEGKGGLLLEDFCGATFSGRLETGSKGYVVTGNQTILTLGTVLIDGSVTIGQQSLLDLTGGGSINHGLSLGQSASLLIHSNTTTYLSGDITGSGSFQQYGTGTVYMNGVNALTTCFVDKGTLIISLAACLGYQSNTLNSGSTLLAANTMTIGARLVLLTADVAAQHGTTLTLNGDVEIAYGDTCSFGSATYDGTVVYAPNASAQMDGEIAVRGGTFVLGNAHSVDLIAQSAFLQVDAGATLDIHGQYPDVAELIGGGTVTNNGQNYDSLTIHGGTFEGTIAGGIAVDAAGDITLAGTGSFDALYIDDGVAVTLGGAASERVYMYQGDTTLILGAASSFTGKISSFASGDAIVLEALHYSNSASFVFDALTKTLMVNDGIGHSESLVFSENHVAGDFSLVQSADGSVEVHAGNQAAPIHAFQPPHGDLPAHLFAPAIPHDFLQLPHQSPHLDMPQHLAVV